ncbi:MAG TPA: peptide chain release factor 1 [Desulfobacter sp.]|jgi:peptide chain release factor 1|uniref:peptide chain release factor 1 n=1 Tax=Desulfobacter sp. UBA2225 TaxID=1961413 RepID=UPI000E977D59|nr:peptide chain release factor 1 [Desulfobacter sp. UBA2225]MBP9598441.1 peptide chain release factor 1 [Desulfobacter sp.]MDQ1269316.1 peptide chain release factor 1 [Thermodesulfobacteriota bacterium]HAR35168.1 peptide chain release factor 1 [Desulfobacter sp.]HRF90445.1 peptide chain release factor 1 [Desulfobacter postgatei]
MIEKLKGIEERFIKIEHLLSDPGVMADQKKYQGYLKEHGELNKIVPVFREYEGAEGELKEAKELLKDSDPDIRAMAKEEIPVLESRISQLHEQINILLMPKDPRDEKNVILEIRAGTGGEEAGIFTGDLFRMYSRYVESKHWKIEIIEKNDSAAGGFKEVVSMVQGKGAYSQFKYESGIHRVQRVPETETQGRVHTSAVTVAVLPEAEDVDIDINPADLKVDVFRSSGPGGQSVNTTDSAVRITHIPTGVVATCQDEKSQHKNKAKALNVLKSRLLDAKIQEEEAKRAADRKGQVGTGDRSGRIRTYNFPQGRMTDHRIGLTLYRLDSIMEGDIQEIIDALRAHNQALALKHN